MHLMRDNGVPVKAVRKTSLPHRDTQMVHDSQFMVKGCFTHEFLTISPLDVNLLNVKSIVFFFKRTRISRIYTNKKSDVIKITMQ